MPKKVKCRDAEYLGEMEIANALMIKALLSYSEADNRAHKINELKLKNRLVTRRMPGMTE